MKKAASIFLLTVFCLYNFGYIFYYQIGSRQVDDYWLQKVVPVTHSNLQTFKYDVTLPDYAVAQSNYTSVDEKVLIKGVEYRVLYKKITHDAVFLKVLPDHLTNDLKNAVDQWLKYVNDSQNDQSTSGQLTFSGSIKDFIPQLNFEFQALRQSNESLSLEESKLLLAPDTEILLPPPRLV